MMKKLFWVWVSMATNPIAWLLLGLGIVMQLGLAIFLWNPNTGWFSGSRGDLVRPSIELTDFGPGYYYGYTFERGADGKAVRVPRPGVPAGTNAVRVAQPLNAVGGEEEKRMWSELAGLRAMKSLEIDGPFDGDLSGLADLTGLESLKLEQYVTPTSRERKIPSLKRLSKLRELEVRSFPVGEIVDAVRENEGLTTLIYRGNLSRDVTVDELKKLAELKQVRVLALGPHVKWDQPGVFKEVFSHFRENKNLKLLSAGGVKEFPADRIREIQELIPGCIVVPMSATPNMLQRFRWGLLAMSGFMWVAGVMACTEAGFRSLGSVMLPGFAMPQLWAAAVLVGSWLALNTFLLCGMGVPLLSALALLVLPAGVFSLAGFQAIPVKPTAGQKWMGLLRVGVVFGVVFGLQFFSMSGGKILPLVGIREELWIEWIRFLYGYHPWPATGGIVLGVWLLVKSGGRAPSTYRRLLEAGHVNPAPMANQQMNPFFDAIGGEKEGELPWMWRPTGEEIERLGELTGTERKKKVWELSTRISSIPRRFWLLMVCIPACGLPVVLQFFQIENGRLPFFLLMVLGVLGGMLPYSLVFLIGHWWSKGSRVGQELLVKPMLRSEMRSLVSRGIWRDMGIAGIGLGMILLGVGMQLWRQGKLPAWDSTGVLGMCLLGVTVVLLFGAFAHSVVTILEGWLGKALLFGGGIGLVGASVGLVMWQALWMDARIDGSLEFLGWGVFLGIGLWMLSRAYRRLIRAEFG